MYHELRKRGTSRPAVLIAAPSGRALAASARRGGYVPLVADFFGDEDTLALAQHARIENGLEEGMDERRLIAALDALSAAHQPIGVVCGSGFEDRPHLLARVAERWRLLGNDPHVVATVKHPVTFAALCRDCGIPHPDTVTSPPPDPTGWLAKRTGGTGGSHIAMTVAPYDASDDYYFQRETRGAPISALFLAHGGRAVVIGFSAQWPLPTRSRPFRYGGAVRPADLAPNLAETLTGAVARLVRAIPLVGLNSADFLVDGDEFRLLEINPRPGATLDIFEPVEGSLFALHIAACEGELDAAPPRMGGAQAAVTVYAECDIASLPAVRWPDWAADRSKPGTAFKVGEPLCTVSATAATAAAAKALVNERLALVLAWTHARMS